MNVCLVADDDTRVVLKDGDSEVKGSDYICAAYIQVCKICIHVIVAFVKLIRLISFYLVMCPCRLPARHLEQMEVG